MFEVKQDNQCDVILLSSQGVSFTEVQTFSQTRPDSNSTELKCSRRFLAKLWQLHPPLFCTDIQADPVTKS